MYRFPVSSKHSKTTRIYTALTAQTLTAPTTTPVPARRAAAVDNKALQLPWKLLLVLDLRLPHLIPVTSTCPPPPWPSPSPPSSPPSVSHAVVNSGGGGGGGIVDEKLLQRPLPEFLGIEDWTLVQLINTLSTIYFSALSSRALFARQLRDDEERSYWTPAAASRSAGDKVIRKKSSHLWKMAQVGYAHDDGFKPASNHC